MQDCQATLFDNDLEEVVDQHSCFDAQSTQDSEKPLIYFAGECMASVTGPSDEQKHCQTAAIVIQQRIPF